MIITIATIFTLLSITASVLLLATLMLSSQISQQEQMVEATIVVKESQPNTAASYFLEN